MPYRHSFVSESIRAVVRPQSPAECRGTAARRARSGILREFAAERLVRSTCTQKMSCRARPGPSINIKMIEPCNLFLVKMRRGGVASKFRNFRFTSARNSSAATKALHCIKSLPRPTELSKITPLNKRAGEIAGIFHVQSHQNGDERSNLKWTRMLIDKRRIIGRMQTQLTPIDSPRTALHICFWVWDDRTMRSAAIFTQNHGTRAPPGGTSTLCGTLRPNGRSDRLGPKRKSIEHSKSYRTMSI
jgi:hypothetical protein